MNIKELLTLAITRNASDLHLVTGIEPHLRIEGALIPIPGEPKVTAEVVDKILKEVLLPEQYERLVVNKELDFSLAFNDTARFRANAYTQKGALAIAFRTIPLSIPRIDDLGLPKILKTGICFGNRADGSWKIHVYCGYD